MVVGSWHRMYLWIIALSIHDLIHVGWAGDDIDIKKLEKDKNFGVTLAQINEIRGIIGCCCYVLDYCRYWICQMLNGSDTFPVVLCPVSGSLALGSICMGSK